jgi:diketogulonate reductase-like aldo/keto reductase
VHKKVISKSKDFSLSPIGMGTMGFGGYFTKDLINNSDQVRLIEEAYESGINVVDTAEIYGEGAAEETIGKTSNNVRNDLFIMSKFSAENSKPKDIIKSIDSSLKRIKRDFLDVYQPHWPQPDVLLIEVIETLEKLKDEGKIRFIGLSNFSKNQINSIDIAVHDSLRFFQCEYNPIERQKAEELMPIINNQDGALIAYSPFREGQIFKSSKFAEFESFSNDLGFLPSQILLAWGISNRRTIVIPKMSSSIHLQENIDTLNIDLSDTDINYISKLFKPKTRQIKPEDIIPFVPVKNDKRKIYKNIDEAKGNIYNLNPGPNEIMQEIIENNGELYKPIKVTETEDGSKYILADGRLRYWAWVILNGWHKPIDSIIIDDFNT